MMRSMVPGNRRRHCEVGHRAAPLPCGAVPRVRLDSLLAERGLYASRTRAAAAVIAGQVHVGPGRARAAKPGQLVAADVELDVDAPPPFVSRGGVKLATALDALGIDVTGRRALDVGASTGGFTDCLLQRGAAHVVALDVAYGELDWRLRSDERVTVVERVERACAGAVAAAVRARPRGRRRVVHLAHEGAPRGPRLRRRAVRLPGDGQAAVRGRARGRRQGRRGAGRRPAPGCDRGRRASGARRRPGLRGVRPSRPGGQPRDVRVAGGAGPARARSPTSMPRSRRSTYEGGDRAHPPPRVRHGGPAPGADRGGAPRGRAAALRRRRDEQARPRARGGNRARLRPPRRRRPLPRDGRGRHDPDGAARVHGHRRAGLRGQLRRGRVPRHRRSRRSGGRTSTAPSRATSRCCSCRRSRSAAPRAPGPR